MVETPTQQKLDSRMTSSTAFVATYVMPGSRDAETPGQIMYAYVMVSRRRVARRLAISGRGI